MLIELTLTLKSFTHLYSNNSMKKVVLLLTAIAATFIILTAGTNTDNGKAGYTNSPGEGNCTTSGCHTSFAVNTGGGSISISSTNMPMMPTLMYDTGVTYHMTVTVARSGNSLFGFCVEALDTTGNNAGTLVITNSAKTQIKTRIINSVVRRSVVQQLNGGASVGSMAFNFDWTSPSTNIGNVSFYFAGVAANGSGTSLGDYVYYSNQVVTFNIVSGISNLNSANKISVFPIPVQDHFNVNYQTKAIGTVKIKLITMQGSLAAELFNKIEVSGEHTENFYLPSNLSAGNYILTIESSEGISAQKILIN